MPRPGGKRPFEEIGARPNAGKLARNDPRPGSSVSDAKTGAKVQALKAKYCKLFGRKPKGCSASDPTWLEREIQKKMQTPRCEDTNKGNCAEELLWSNPRPGSSVSDAKTGAIVQALKAQYCKLFDRNPKGRKASDPTWLKDQIQKKMKTLKDDYFDCYGQHPSGPDANEPGWLRQQILNRCSQILNDISGKPEAKDFLQPVPWTELGLDNYLVECPEPMDLGTVRQKIQTYSDLGNFKHDVMLTFKNAMHYNRDDSEIWKRAETLLKDFEALFKSPEMVAVQEEEAAREKYRDLKELCKRAKREVGEKTQKRKELEQRAVKTQLRAVETQLGGEKMAHQVTRSKLEAEEAARQQAETQLKDCQSRTKKQIQDLKIQVYKLQKFKKKALQEAADAQRDLQRKNDDLRRAQNELKDTKTALDKTRSTVDDTQKELAILRRSMISHIETSEELTTTREELEGTQKQLAKQTQELQKIRNEFQIKSDTLTQNMDSKDHHISKIQSELAELRKENKGLKAMISYLTTQSKLEELKEENRDLNMALQQAKTQLEQLKQIQPQVKTELKNAKMDRDNAQKACKKTRFELEAEKKAHFATMSELEAEKKAHQRAVNQLRQTKIELTLQQSTHDDSCVSHSMPSTSRVNYSFLRGKSKDEQFEELKLRFEKTVKENEVLKRKYSVASLLVTTHTKERCRKLDPDWKRTDGNAEKGVDKVLNEELDDSLRRNQLSVDIDPRLRQIYVLNMKARRLEEIERLTALDAQKRRIANRMQGEIERLRKERNHARQELSTAKKGKTLTGRVNRSLDRRPRQ